jgi:hypothetical protein
MKWEIRNMKYEIRNMKYERNNLRQYLIFYISYFFLGVPLRYGVLALRAALACSRRAVRGCRCYGVASPLVSTSARSALPLPSLTLWRARRAREARCRTMVRLGARLREG